MSFKRGLLKAPGGGTKTHRARFPRSRQPGALGQPPPPPPPPPTRRPCRRPARTTGWGGLQALPSRQARRAVTPDWGPAHPRRLSQRLPKVLILHEFAY